MADAIARDLAWPPAGVLLPIITVPPSAASPDVTLVQSPCRGRRIAGAPSDERKSGGRSTLNEMPAAQSCGGAVEKDSIHAVHQGTRRMKDSRWPNLFVIGAAKAGTTSLNHYLAQHPEIFMSPMKEPHFFSRIQPSPELEPFFPHVSEEGPYLALFAEARQRVRGEASTSYLTDPAAADRISKTCPDAKIVMILRDPVDRAYSHYWNDVREGIEQRPFAQAISEELAGPPGRWGVSSLYVECGRYCAPVARYLERFHANALVIFFEEFVSDVPRTLERLFTFLDVDPAWATRIESEARNPFALPRNALSRRLLASGTARTVSRKLLPRSLRALGRRQLVTAVDRPPLEPDLGLRLVELYRPDVDRLCELLGRRPPWPAFEETGGSSSTKRLSERG